MKTAKRRKYKLVRNLLCVVSALSALALCIVKPLYNSAVTLPLMNGEYCSAAEDVDNIEIYTKCRNAIYSDLCTLGTVYLPNCQNGKFTGTPKLYESMLGTLSWFTDEESDRDPFGVKSTKKRGLSIAQSQYKITSIDSDYYWFFVSNGSEYLTNINDFKVVAPDEMSEMPEKLKAAYPDWYYLRNSDLLNFVTKYNESGRGKTEVYYTVSDKKGSVELTSEYIDSDRMMLGTCGTDNLGNYLFCFNDGGDKSISSYYTEKPPESVLHMNSDGSVTLISGRDYYVEDDGTYEEYSYDYGDDNESTYEKGTDRYYELLNTFGGVVKGKSWIELKDLPDYEFSQVDTSKMIVFMSPKTDIPAAIQSTIDSCKDDYWKYHKLLDLFTVLCILSLSAAAVLTLVRPKEQYCEDSGPLKKFFKLDVSIAALIASAAGLAFATDDTNHFMYTNRTEFSARFSHFAHWGALIAAACFVMILSLEGIVRWIKADGLRHPDLMITRIWKRTTGTRRKAARIPFIKWHRGLTLTARYKIMIAEILISGTISLLAFVNNEEDITVYSFFIFIAFVLRFLVTTLRLVIGIGRVEKQADNMLLPENEQVRFKPVGKTSPLKPLSERLGEVSRRAEQAVEQQVQSERMKIELVTNVSHDLKTPLTSIISYIDLLEKCDISGEARDYVTIISKKADKLREIVNDVFSLAKAVSGVEVEMTEIDLAVLTRQVLADNSDKTSASGRELRITIVPENAPIMGDGMKLYRVIQNLLDNALKYSMPFTRIYLDITENDDGYELTVKNISEREINFTADEIIERFARGDKSRTDGGSGLGLSIAKSFTEACGGSFAIELDGDLFKACVKFPKNDTKPVALLTDSQYLE